MLRLLSFTARVPGICWQLSSLNIDRTTVKFSFSFAEQTALVADCTYRAFISSGADDTFQQRSLSANDPVDYLPSTHHMAFLYLHPRVISRILCAFSPWRLCRLSLSCIVSPLLCFLMASTQPSTPNRHGIDTRKNDHSQGTKSYPICHILHYSPWVR